MSNSRTESAAFQTIVGKDMLVQDFFDRVWQKSCAVFPARDQSTTIDERNGNGVESCAYTRLISNGWQALVQLLEDSRGYAEEDSHTRNLRSSVDSPIFFRNKEGLSMQERESVYGSSPFSAYLDGCSLVQNHADLLSPALALLCQDLQNTFPHAYCNTYITPPDSQAVPPHADDRDVLVIQVYGAKEWTVYGRIPIPYPYPHEQVGKDGRAIPTEVLEGPVLIQRTLEAGDVMYMPRGHVHFARATSNQMSFHVTVALATHDWTLAGMCSNYIGQILHSVVDYRRALPRDYGTGEWDQISTEKKEWLQSELDQAISLLKRELTPEVIHDGLHQKYEMHNTRARERREYLINKGQNTMQVVEVQGVGKEAARKLTLDSMLRLTTPDEKTKAQLEISNGGKQVGLHVRETVADDIGYMLNKLRENPELQCRVGDLRGLMSSGESGTPNPLLCDLTLLSFAKQCVALGALAVV